MVMGLTLGPKYRWHATTTYIEGKNYSNSCI